MLNKLNHHWQLLNTCWGSKLAAGFTVYHVCNIRSKNSFQNINARVIVSTSLEWYCLELSLNKFKPKEKCVQLKMLLRKCTQLLFDSIFKSCFMSLTWYLFVHHMLGVLHFQNFMKACLCVTLNTCLLIAWGGMG